jgi:hypothetical protein
MFLPVVQSAVLRLVWEMVLLDISIDIKCSRIGISIGSQSSYTAKKTLLNLRIA